MMKMQHNNEYAIKAAIELVIRTLNCESAKVKSLLRDIFDDIKDPYSSLVLAFLLQRTHPLRCREVFKRFLEQFKTIDDLCEASHETLEDALRSLGLQKERAKRLKIVASYIRKKYQGTVPKNKTDLLSIPYVGEYVASVILSRAFDLPVIVRDENVLRVLSRIAGKELPRQKTFDLLEMYVRPKDKRRFSLFLIHIGVFYCKSQPKCGHCPLKITCKYHLESKANGRVETQRYKK